MTSAIIIIFCLLSFKRQYTIIFWFMSGHPSRVSCVFMCVLRSRRVAVANAGTIPTIHTHTNTRNNECSCRLCSRADLGTCSRASKRTTNMSSPRRFCIFCMAAAVATTVLRGRGYLRDSLRALAPASDIERAHPERKQCPQKTHAPVRCFFFARARMFLFWAVHAPARTARNSRITREIWRACTRTGPKINLRQI